MTAVAGGGRWVLVLESGDPDRLAEAAAMAASAASLGTDVTVVWLAGALRALLSGFLEAKQEPASAARLLAEARDTGRVRLLACSAAMVRCGASPERVRENVDEIVGWPTVVSLLRSAERSFVW
jgi:peroxiredoxin family protein